VSTDYPKKNNHISKTHPQNKHVTKERGYKCGKVGDYKCKGGHGGHGAKVVT
jgi:hypothetical protein